MFGLCVCVYFFLTLSTKLSPRKKKLGVNFKEYFAFLPVSIYLTVSYFLPFSSSFTHDEISLYANI